MKINQNKVVLLHYELSVDGKQAKIDDIVMVTVKPPKKENVKARQDQFFERWKARMEARSKPDDKNPGGLI